MVPSSAVRITVCSSLESLISQDTILLCHSWITWPNALASQCFNLCITNEHDLALDFPMSKTIIPIYLYSLTLTLLFSVWFLKLLLLQQFFDSIIVSSLMFYFLTIYLPLSSSFPFWVHLEYMLHCLNNTLHNATNFIAFLLYSLLPSKETPTLNVCDYQLSWCLPFSSWVQHEKNSTIGQIGSIVNPQSPASNDISSTAQ